MDIQMILKAIIEMGITPVLLVVFVKYFLERDKTRDAQLAVQYKNFQERENIIIAEGSRREEIIRKESEKREKILRDEAQKRENHFMAMLEDFSENMAKISQAMEGIKNSNLQMEIKIENIESKIESLKTEGRAADGLGGSAQT